MEAVAVILWSHAGLNTAQVYVKLNYRGVQHIYKDLQHLYEGF